MRILGIVYCAIFGCVGFVIGLVFGPLVHGIMLGVEQVSAFIDRNTDG